MRLEGKRSSQACVKRDLRIEFAAQRLTSYSGLELLDRVPAKDRSGRPASGSVRETRDLGRLLADLDGSAVARFAVGRRSATEPRGLRAGADPLMCRLARLRLLPHERTLSRWLKQFTYKSVRVLAEVNTRLVSETLRTLGCRRVTLDVDGSVVSTGLQVAWAKRGFNPHHRKVPSYYPILAHVAQTGQILAVKNRPGQRSRRQAVRVLHSRRAATGPRRTGFQGDLRIPVGWSVFPASPCWRNSHAGKWNTPSRSRCFRGWGSEPSSRSAVAGSR